MPANGSAERPPDDRLQRASSTPKTAIQLRPPRRAGSSAFAD